MSSSGRREGALPDVPPLADCAREPIHIPGAIQPHGALIAFEPGGGTVLHASANVGRWLAAGEHALRGRSLIDLLGEPGYALVMQALAARGGAVRHQVVDLPARPEHGQPLALEGVVHAHRGVCLLELEAVAPQQAGHDWMQTLADAIEGLRSARDLGDLVERTAQRVKRLTRFDRVMVYTFDAQADGHVIADAREPDMESFYDLHYPASDIPAQARELYVSNLVRYLADVDAAPEPVLPGPDGERIAPLDMSHSMLRSMSPVHLQYLRNMGVASTLTLSILVDGRLWGLIACHHRTPTCLPVRLRRACHALAVSAGYMVGWNEQRQRALERAEAARVRDRIVEAFNQVALPLADVIEQSASDLARLVGASGGAFWREGQVQSFGQWPTGARGDSILRHVRQTFETSTFEMIDTEQALLDPPLQPAEARQVAGLLAIRLDGFSASGIVWLRPEHRREVAWGGDPGKPAEIELDTQGRPRLTPRSSFARWEVAVSGRGARPTATQRVAWRCWSRSWRCASRWRR